MVNRIRASDPRGLNKRRSSKFRVGSRVWQETPEEDRVHVSRNVVNLTIKMTIVRKT